MAREILFKAKRTDNGEWVYGNYAFDDTKGERHFIFQNFGFEYEVDKDTICQYTGLTDENGRKIFENDILKDSDNEYLMVVRWDDENARFVLDDYGYSGCFMEYGWDETAGEFGVVETYDFDDFYSINEHCEILGNKFDNPELLGGGADNG